jgi:hypothetical protein
MEQETMNMSIRRFLKTVGVHSQREIESAIHHALESGKIKGDESLYAKMTLNIEGIELSFSLDGTIDLE